MLVQFLGVYPVYDKQALNTPCLRYVFLGQQTNEHCIRAPGSEYREILHEKTSRILGYYASDQPSLLPCSTLESDRNLIGQYHETLEQLSLEVFSYRKECIDAYYNWGKRSVNNCDKESLCLSIHLDKADPFISQLKIIIQREFELSLSIVGHWFEIDGVRWIQDYTKEKGEFGMERDLWYSDAQGTPFGCFWRTQVNRPPRLRHLGPCHQGALFDFSTAPIT